MGTKYLRTDEKRRILNRNVLCFAKKELSDVIIREESGLRSKFENTMTGKVSSELSDVTRDKRFIVLRKDSEDKCRELGIFVKYFDDILYIICAYYKKKRNIVGKIDWQWVEVRRSVITKSNESLLYASFPSGIWVDMCGQQKIKKMGTMPLIGDCVFPCSVQKTLLEFYGGPVFIESIDMLCSHKPRILTFDAYHASDLAYLDEIMHYNMTATPSRKVDIIHHGVPSSYRKNATDRAVSFTKENIKLPVGAKNAIDEYLKLWQSQGLDCAFKTDGLRVSIIQKHKGMCVSRTFMPVVSIGNTMEETAAQMYEVGRFYFSPYFIPDAGDMLNATPIWASPDLKGTYLEYTRNFLDDWLFIYKEFVEDCKASLSQKSDESEFENKLKKAYKEYSYIYSITPRFCVYNACVLGKDPILEKAAKACHGKSPRCKNPIFNSAHIAAYEPDNVTWNLFGEVNRDAKELHKMLMLPKGLLEKAVISRVNLEDMRRVKNAFLSRNEYEYFSRLNDHDVTMLVDFLFLGNETISPNGQHWIFERLIYLFGVENWFEYTRFIMNKLNSGIFEAYKDFLLHLTTLSRLDGGCDMLKKFKWKLTDKALNEERQKLEEMLFLFDCGDYEKVRNIYLERGKMWKKYAFDCDGFKIAWPTKPEDLLREGIALNHCAKSYVAYVAKGETTVLFVRKKDTPDKPYYTLEIQKEKIRQCHGFDNCNMDEDESLVKFMQKFCENKGIEFSLGNNLYGGDEDWAEEMAEL